MSFFEIFQMFSSNVWIYGGSFILILSILVFIHEWGHYIVARWCGIKVETFSIGFGKELIGFNDKNGTRWKISLIPLGGYVQLFGFDDPDSEKNQNQDEAADNKKKKTKPLSAKEKDVAFFAKPVWKRAAVVAAGPAINYLFAILVLAGLYFFNGQPVTPPSAAAIVGDSAAYENGFQPHDLIVSIDGAEMQSFEDLRRSMMINLDAERHFVVKREGKLVDIYARPKRLEMEDRFGFKHSRGMLGIISPRHAINIKNVVRIEDQTFEEGDIEAVRAELTKRMGQVFEVEINRGAGTDGLLIHPLPEFNQAFGVEGERNENHLFISDMQGNVFVKYGLHIAFYKAGVEAWEITTGTLKALGQMVMGTRSATELGGVIRIGALAGDMAKQGFIALVLFTALLSINLGLINLFPIPLLDGGHLLFYAVEAVAGKPIPDQIQEYAFRFGLVFLVGIMVFANLNDILQLFL